MESNSWAFQSTPTVAPPWRHTGRRILVPLSLIALVRCRSDGPISPTDVTVQIVSGNNQSGAVNTELPTPLVVKATTPSGAPIAGLTVNFVVVSGGGTMFGGSASTDNDGNAADYWTLGTSTAEDQRVEVRAVFSNGEKQVFGVFTATALAGPVSASNSTIDASPLTIAEESPATITVTVQDAYGNPVGAATVLLSVSGSGNTITQPSNTDASGVATGSVSSTFGEEKTVSASANGTAIIQTAMLAVLPGPPTQIAVYAGDNQTALMGTAVAVPPAVIIKDKYGSPIPSVAAIFTPATGSGRVVGGSDDRPNASFSGPDGVATSDGWIIGCNASNTLVVNLRDFSHVSGDPVTFTAFGSPHECWYPRASMLAPRWSLGVGVVNGIVYAAGGRNTRISVSALTTLESYDPVTDTWAAKAPMPTGRYGLGVGVVNGILYALGGVGINNGTTVVEAYDPTTNSWTTKTPMHTARTFVAVGVVDGILYAVGGCSTDPCPADRYDPATDTWTTKASMPTSRIAFGVGVVNGILYAVGGTGSAGITGIVEAYDPATDTWTTKASMPTPRYGLAVVPLNGILYAVGGTTDALNGILGTVEAYDPSTDSWTTKTPMTSPRVWLGAGVVDGILYALGGDRGRSYSNFIANHEEYRP